MLHTVTRKIICLFQPSVCVQDRHLNYPERFITEDIWHIRFSGAGGGGWWGCFLVGFIFIIIYFILAQKPYIRLARPPLELSYSSSPRTLRRLSRHSLHFQDAEGSHAHFSSPLFPAERHGNYPKFGPFPGSQVAPAGPHGSRRGAAPWRAVGRVAGEDTRGEKSSHVSPVNKTLKGSRGAVKVDILLCVEPVPSQGKVPAETTRYET